MFQVVEVVSGDTFVYVPFPSLLTPALEAGEGCFCAGKLVGFSSTALLISWNPSSKDFKSFGNALGSLRNTWNPLDDYDFLQGFASWYSFVPLWVVLGSSIFHPGRSERIRRSRWEPSSVSFGLGLESLQRKGFRPLPLVCCDTSRRNEENLLTW